MRIYISGPISADIGVEYEEKKERFRRAEKVWTEAGYEVINPLTVGACEDRLCGGRETPGEHGGFHHTWKCYMRYDLIALLRADIIGLLPGWTESPGAMLEYQVAERLDYPVYYLDADGCRTLGS